MNGPWKFSGLSGLILEATDDSGLYKFIATGIQQTQRPMITMYSADDYEKIDRIEFLKAKRQFIDNPLGAINTQLSGLNLTINDLGDVLQSTSREDVDLIETDY